MKVLFLFGPNLGALGRRDPVDAAHDPVDVHALGLGRLHERLVVDGEVVHDVRVGVVAAVHALDAGADDVRDLIPVGRVVCDSRGVR